MKKEKRKKLTIIPYSLYPIPESFRYFNKTLNPFFDVLPNKFLKVNSSLSFVSIWKTSFCSSLYLLQSSNTSWTVSSRLHCEHRPVGCFPILLSVCLSPVCPILSRVKIISSLRFLPHILLFLTCGCILYTVTMFMLSQLSCQTLYMCLLIIDLISSLLNGISMFIEFQYICFFIFFEFYVGRYPQERNIHTFIL